MWRRGNAEGIHKISPSEKHRTIKLNNGERVDILALQYIKNYVLSLKQTKKTAGMYIMDVNEVIGDGALKSSDRKGMKDAYLKIIDGIGKDTSKVSPKFGFLLF